VATQKQRQAARKNVKKAQSGARRQKSITKLPKKTRTALGREGARQVRRARQGAPGQDTCFAESVTTGAHWW
jgi:hypothetical protein